MTQKNEVWPNGMPEVGQKAQRSREVTSRDIELFTEISGDRNPIHYDEKAAAATRFGGIVVQGCVTSAILNAVVAENLPGPGTVFLQVNWSFKAPVRPGDTITARSKSPRSAPTSPSRNSIHVLCVLITQWSLMAIRSATQCHSRSEIMSFGSLIIVIDSH